MPYGSPVLLDTNGSIRGKRIPLYVSVGVHILLVIALLRGRSPVFVAPSFVLKGANGTSVTPLYWVPDDTNTAPQTNVRPDIRTAALNWTPRPRKPTKLITQRAGLDAENQKEAASLPPERAAGSPYGSLTEGPASGQQIRPALPMTTFEPAVSPDDLQGIAEGNVVVEITIDESGNIIAKNVVQSLGAALDAKVLAALENWHFRPATRDGVPIPSKQDVVYHFKPH
jgi:TonB family protein